MASSKCRSLTLMRLDPRNVELTSDGGGDEGLAVLDEEVDLIVQQVRPHEKRFALKSAPRRFHLAGRSEAMEHVTLDQRSRLIMMLVVPFRDSEGFRARTARSAECNELGVSDRCDSMRPQQQLLLHRSPPRSGSDKARPA